MKSAIQLAEAKYRRAVIFSLMIISFMMLSCNYDQAQINAESESATPIADITNGLVMTGTATITYYKTKTCTNAGTAVLTVNPDGTFKMVANGPSVDDNCLHTGDRTNATFYGTVAPAAFEMYITSCMLDRQPVGQTDGWITNVDAGGEAICYSVKPNGDRGTKYYYVQFDVEK